MPHETLSEFLLRLTAGPAAALPPGEDWAALIGRITTEGVVNEITEETWDYFLDVLPPRWLGRGAFAFAEGEEPLCFFWKRGGRFFCRKTTWEETREFYRLARGGAS